MATSTSSDRFSTGREMTMEQKIAIASTILAENKPKACPDRPLYAVCTSLLKDHPLNGIAPLLSWAPGEGAYAIAYSRRRFYARVYIAGEDGVPSEKVKFLEDLWERLYNVRTIKRTKKKRTEGNALDKQIPEETFLVWELVVAFTHRKLRKRILKHLPFVQMLKEFITPHNIRDNQARAFLVRFIEAFTLLDTYQTRVEAVDGPQAATMAFSKHRDLLAIFMILTAQFHNQMSNIWKTIDDIAILNSIGCDTLGPRAHKNYSRHFVKICLIFLQTYSLIESTRAPNKGWMWDTGVEAHIVDRRFCLPKQAPDDGVYAQQVHKVATEVFSGTDDDERLYNALNLDFNPQEKAISPELQIILAFKDDCPASIYRFVSSSRPTPYLTELLLPLGTDEETWKISKGVGSLYKRWCLPTGLLPYKRLREVYDQLRDDIVGVARDTLECGENGLTRAEQEEDERLRIREARLKEYRQEIICHTEKMIRVVLNMPDDN